MSVFTPLSPAEVEREARRLTKRGDGGITAGCTFIFAFVSLLIPVIGPFVCVVLLICWVCLLFAGPDKHQVAGLAHRMRGAARGACPICRADIILWGRGAVPCPKCSTLLTFDGTSALPTQR